MKPVTGVGAPWYTSGVHMWNGTAATLNPKPTRISAAPINISGRLDTTLPVPTNAPLACRTAMLLIIFSEVLPVAPKTSAMP